MNSTGLRQLTCRAILSAYLLSFSTSAHADALDNWTVIPVSTNSFQLSHVVYGNGRYVAAGGRADGGAIMSSEDGLHWILRADGGLQYTPHLVWDLAYGDGRFVVVGLEDTGSSTNGVDWTFSGPMSSLYGVAYGRRTFPPLPGRFVAVGPWGGIYYSTNGINWASGVKDIAETRTVFDVAYGANRFVAVAAGGYRYISGDGNFWTRGVLPGEASNIGFCNGKFFAPYGPGTNLVSLDGVDWAVLGTGVPGVFGRIGFAGGMFVGFTGGVSDVNWGRWAYTNLVTSLDGTNWVLRGTYPFYSTVDSEDSAFEIASDGRRLITVGAIRPGPDIFSFNAFVAVSDPMTDIGLTGGLPLQIVLSGLVGRPYRVEYLPSLPASITNPWQTLTNLVLPSSPYLLSDPEAPNSTQRYYRAVLLP